MAENVNVWQAVKRHPFLALLPVVVFLAAGVGLGVARHPVYTATTRMYVQVPASDPAALFSLTDAAAGLASAYSRAVDATAVVSAVARDLSSDPAAVAGRTSATPVPDSPVVKVSAQASTSAAAVSLANTTANELRRYISGLNESDAASQAALAAFSEATRSVTRAQARIRSVTKVLNVSPAWAKAQLENARAALEVALLRRDAARARYSTLQTGQQPTLQTLRTAAIATSDHRSKLELFIFVGLVAGAVAGAALATGVNSLDVRVRSGEEVADELGLPLLARIPRTPGRRTKGKRAVVLAGPEGSHADALRMLRTNLEFANAGGPTQVIMFVSAVRSEGRSETAASLGVTLARLGERVVLVDLDLRRPGLAQYFGVSPDVGVSDVVLGRSTVGTAVSHVSLNGPVVGNGNGGGPTKSGRTGARAALDVLAAGALPPYPGDFVSSPELPALFAELRRDYDVVLVDTPPALAVGDAMTLSKVADGLVVVAKPSRLSRPRVRELHRRLDACLTRKLGVVVVGEQTTPV
jgi:Mrp family chromosome partitioning ATPase/capsular polysaccharide biosynthesis protein